MRADQWSPRLQPGSPVAPVSGGRSCHGRFQRRERRASVGAGPPRSSQRGGQDASTQRFGSAGRSPWAESGRRGRKPRARKATAGRPRSEVVPRHPVARSKRRLWDLNTCRGSTKHCRLPAPPACLAVRCAPRHADSAGHQPARSSGVACSAAKRSSRRCRCTI